MTPFSALRGWTKEQKHVVFASYLGWTLDAFDFFLLVFVLSDVAKEFGIAVKPHPLVLGAAYASLHGVLAKTLFLAPLVWDRFIASLTGSHGLDITIVLSLTLALRPVGAFFFGRLADRFGRRPIMMFDVVTYALLAFASAFSPNFTVFLVLRALFGVAMGGEWGIGASLTMESIPPQARGIVSGMLQAGYPSGYLIASVAYTLLFPMIGWRGMFMLGILPALLIFYVRRHVPESPGWSKNHATESVTNVLRKHWKLALYAILLMTCFNFFSHGTQDLYPTFLKIDRKLDSRTVGTIAIIYNIGAILGGLTFGAISQGFGRRRTLVVGALLALPVIPLWAFANGFAALAVGAFVMQFVVQGCWGVVPAHLNELSPKEVRGTFPGVVYQLGNFIASTNATIQGALAAAFGGELSYALMIVAVFASITIAFLSLLGREARDVDMRIAET